MRFLATFAVLGLSLYSAVPLSANQEFLEQVAETNVNQRYMVESVSVAGVEVNDDAPARIPRSLRLRLKELVGSRCDFTMLEELSSQIRRELHLRSVSEHLSRGSQPDTVRVNFDVVRQDLAFDVSLPRFLYHSKQGFTGEVDASTRFKQNNFTFGLTSNGDDLTERFSGLSARYESAPLGTEHLHLGVTFEDYHEQWSSETRDALGASGLDLYRARWNVAPELTFAVARPLTVSVGASFQSTESETPAMGSRSANAATLDLHYGRKIEGDDVQQQVEGKYSLRVATHALGSTYAYARHLISVRYEAKSGRHTVTDEMMGGSIAGNAPFSNASCSAAVRPCVGGTATRSIRWAEAA